jgi:hypothetical protein
VLACCSCCQTGVCCLQLHTQYNSSRQHTTKVFQQSQREMSRNVSCLTVTAAAVLTAGIPACNGPLGHGHMHCCSCQPSRHSTTVLHACSHLCSRIAQLLAPPDRLHAQPM